MPWVTQCNRTYIYMCSHVTVHLTITNLEVTSEIIFLFWDDHKPKGNQHIGSRTRTSSHVSLVWAFSLQHVSYIRNRKGSGLRHVDEGLVPLALIPGTTVFLYAGTKSFNLWGPTVLQPAKGTLEVSREVRTMRLCWKLASMPDVFLWAHSRSPSGEVLIDLPIRHEESPRKESLGEGK